MPTVRCVCGTEILVLPDLKAMNRAIKNHVAGHKDGFALDSLEPSLTEKVLTIASEINLDTANDCTPRHKQKSKVPERVKKPLDSA